MYLRNLFTRARLTHIETAEGALPITDLVHRAGADAVVEDFNFPVVVSTTEVHSGSSN